MNYERFSRKQLLTLLWWKQSELNKYDGLICDGSVRSGKTVAMSVGFLLWAMSTFDGCKFALCGKTIEALRRNVVSLIPGLMDGIMRVQERRSDNTMTVWGFGHVNTFYLFGGRDESSYTLIQGMTLAGVLFDEVALMPRSFVEQALARCSISGSRYWFNCNPEGSSHWFYREWILKAEAHNVLHLHFTMADNLALDPAVRARYETMYTGVFYQRYILGLWVAAEGRIYDCFDPAKHVAGTLPELAGDCYVSCDYGTQNATVFLLWQRERGTERWICRREYYYSGREQKRQKTDKEFCADLGAWLGDDRPRAVVVDPSAASFIAELRQAGCPVQQADNEVLDGIRNVSTRLRAGTLLFSASCVHTAEEFQAYVWDEKAAERGEDKPAKVNDHCMDAVRYFVTTILGRQVVRVGKRPARL